MQLEHLQYLVTVIECGSMNKAAKMLFCTQPAITSAIKAIENELGYPIIKRTQNGTELAQYGEMVLKDARLMLSYVDNWKKLASVESSHRPVDITVSGTTPFEIITTIVDMQKTRPEININMHFQPLLSSAMERGTSPAFRLGLFYRVPEHIPRTKKYAIEHGLSIAILKKSEFVLFINALNALAQKDDVVLEDLRNKRVLLYQSPRDFPCIDKLRSVNCDVDLQVYQEENLMKTVAAFEDSISIRPLLNAYKNVYVEEKLIVTRPTIDCPMPVHLCLMYPDSEHIWESERAFLDNIMEIYTDFEVL